MKSLLTSLIFIILFFQIGFAGHIEQIVKIKSSNDPFEEKILRQNELLYFQDSKLIGGVIGDIAVDGTIKKIWSIFKSEEVKQDKMYCDRLYTFKNDFNVSVIDLKALEDDELIAGNDRGCMFAYLTLAKKFLIDMQYKYLLKYYVQDLVFLLNSIDESPNNFTLTSKKLPSGEQEVNVEVKKEYILMPMIHMEYGIYQRAVLSSFSFIVKDGLLLKDEYKYFENTITFTREYSYTLNKTLREVSMQKIIDDKENNSIESYFYKDKFLPRAISDINE